MFDSGDIFDSEYFFKVSAQRIASLFPAPYSLKQEQVCVCVCVCMCVILVNISRKSYKCVSFMQCLANTCSISSQLVHYTKFQAHDISAISLPATSRPLIHILLTHILLMHTLLTHTHTNTHTHYSHTHTTYTHALTHHTHTHTCSLIF